MKTYHNVLFIMIILCTIGKMANAQNVGIGIQLPSDKLTISSVDSNTVRLLGPGIYTSKARLSFGDGTYVFLEEDQDDKLTVFASGRISLMGGNVGIGTKNPVWPLDIVGSNPDDGAEFQMSNSDKSQFIRMFSGRLNDPSPFLSWQAGVPFKFASANNDFSQFAEWMRISATGNVGIGLTNPLYILDIEDQSRFSVDLTNAIYVKFGNMTSSFNVVSFESAGSAQIVLDNNNNDPDSKSFQIRKNSSTGTVLMTVQEDGRVGIGTTSLATGHLLSVNGKIAALEVRVQPQNDWPDFVFAQDYSLLSLDDLQKSIETHRHLPGVPSAEEVKNSGILIGEMQALSMEKLEELTLYILQLNNEIRDLRQQVQQLQQNSPSQTVSVDTTNNK